MSKVKIEGNASGTGTFTIAAPNSNTDRTLTLPDEAGTVTLDGVKKSGDTMTGNLIVNADVGIGTSSPTAKFSMGAASAASYPTYTNLSAGNNQAFIAATINSADTYNTMIDIGGMTGNTDTLNGGSSIRFLTQPKVSPFVPVERMRIDSSGYLLVNTTSAHSNARVQVKQGNLSFAVLDTWHSGTSGTRYHLEFRDGSTPSARGSITTNGSSTSFNTTSDYRLKEDWQPMTGSIDRLKALNPVNFAWKVDGSRVDGFLAHEAAEVVPEAVSGEKDAVDDEGSPVYQGIDQSKLVPLLTAALQEAVSKIEALETRIAALEATA